MATRHMIPAGPIPRRLRHARGGDGYVGGTIGIEAADKPALKAARRIHFVRRQRDMLFGPGLFGDPGWDILLNLYIAAHDGRRMSVCDTCMGTALPQTTVLRWVGQLVAIGLVTKRDDPRDARRVDLRLTPRAIRKLDMLLGDALRTGPDEYDGPSMLAAE